MKRCAQMVTVLAVAATLLMTAGCNKLKARDQLNKGVKAYRNANYEEAIEKFKNAVEFDPDLKVAKLYLATAYAQQYVPGVGDPANVRMAQQAIDEYQKVLESDPKSVNSLKGIAFLYMQMKDFAKSRDYYKKAIEVDPDDPEIYYSVGVIDWTQAYKDAADLKSANGMKVDDELKGKGSQKWCDQLKAKDEGAVDEGMKMLQTAIEKRQDYDDAMAYMNLLYRRKANDMTCDDAQARADYIKTANEWSDKAMAARKKKAEEAAKKNQGGIVLEPQNQSQQGGQPPSQK
ncbi:MAG TPA: tetratricopeptide repeat protein [Candidatus Acidoferrales bacterium]|jgi:tetratricopeptide (TPR) repeat protein|nr:tetratricopeptide repeat protein [Candidatus Acidoferrales bacterium]